MSPPVCRFILTLTLLAGYFTASAPAHGAPPAPAEIKRIIIRGQKMVAEETIRTRVQSREGTPFDPDRITRDVQAIYELGFFEDVQVEAEGFEGGLQIIFNLTEKPIIKSIDFEGNEQIKSDKLREKLKFSAHTVYSPETVSQAVQQLNTIYREKGYYHVTVDTRMDTVGEGEAQLVFVIREGEKHHITTISFSGNRAFSDRKLRGEVKTKRRGFWSFLTDSGRLQKEVLQDDRQQILNFYQDHGYIEARVGEPEITVREDENKLEIMIPITEGEQYRLGKIDLRGDTLIPLEQIHTVIASREGEIFRRETFSKDLFTINQLYSRRGYAYVAVDYSTKIDQAQRTIDVTLQVDKKEEVRIGRIRITGNVTTRDKVIRREITFREGDLFNSDALRRSRQKIMNLGFFESVDLLPHPRGEDIIDINIDLKERLTGAISFGVGYSSEDKVAGQVRLSESNLFGRGQSLQLMTEYGPVRKNYSLSFAERSVFDSRYSFSFSIYNTLKEYSEYDRKSIGGRITVGRSLGEYFRAFLSYKQENVDISDVTEDASSFILSQEGERLTRSVRLSLSRDSRDNYFNPTTGNRTVLSTELAGGPLGGDNYFTKHIAETSFYFPLFWKLVLMQHGEIGTISGFDGREVPIYEKFFMGGIYSVRGFQPRTVGPKDENGDPIGGVKKLQFNTEIIMPLVPEQGMNLVVFFDAGNAFDVGESLSLSSLRTGAGAGIRWLSPLGPFRLEWGYNLDREEGEPSSDWAFTIGAFF